MISDLCRQLKDYKEFDTYLHFFFDSKNLIHDENNSLEKQEKDILIAQKIMFHIKEFFIVTEIAQKTRRKKQNLNRTTRKKTN